MFRLASVIASALLLGACSATTKPVSIEGECGIFRDPGFPVRGARDKDQRWITRTQETGISVCGWPRPAPEREEPTVAEVPAPPAPSLEPPKRRLRSWLGL